MRKIQFGQHNSQDMTMPEPQTRRRWSRQEKLAIVQQTYGPGQSVPRIASHYAINPNMLFLWRKQYEQGLLRPLAPGEAGVPAVLLMDALKKLRELQHLLEKKTQEAEVLKLTMEYDRQVRMNNRASQIGTYPSKNQLRS